MIDSPTPPSYELSILKDRKINLKIQQKKLYLDKLVLLEYADINLIKALQKSDKFKKEFENKYSHYHAKQEFKNVSQQLEGYMKRYDKKKECFKVEYKKPRHKYGRVFPTKALGFTSFSKNVRNTLMKDNYIDFDIKNCQVEIIKNVAENNEMELKSIGYYCHNRDNVLEEVSNTYDVTRKQAKSLFLTLSFYGTFNSWCNKNKIVGKKSLPFIDTYIRDIDSFYNTIKKENISLYNLARKKNKENVKGSFLSLYLQEQEAQIIDSVVYYLAENTDIMNYPNTTYKVGTYEYDGIKLLKKNVEPYGVKKLIQLMEKIVYDETGFKIKFEEKKIEGGINIEYEKVEKKEEEETECIEGVESDLEASELVIKLYPYWKFCKNNLYVFNDKNGLWSSNSNIHHSIISRYKEQLREVKVRPDGTKYVGRKSYGSDAQLIKKCITFICSNEECVNDDWLDEVSETSRGKLLFNNGILYTKKKKLLFTTKFNSNIVFFEKINADFDDGEFLDEVIEDVKKRFFYDVLGEEVGKYYIEHLARAIFGSKMKRYIIAIGDSNSGKSTLTKCLEKSFGAYIGTYAGENLLYKKGSSADSGQKMRWALRLQYKRIIISNEISMGQQINGNTLKKLCGGDRIEGRNHGEGEKSFIPHFSPIMMCNDIPTIKPYDDAVDGRLKIIGYKKVYVDEVTDEDTELKGNINIDSEINTFEFQEIFRSILFLAYKDFLQNGEMPDPLGLSVAKETYVEDNTSIIELFQEAFEITNNEDDFIESNSLKEWVKETNAKISVKKLSLEIKKYCKKNNLLNVGSKVKKINNKHKRVWVGIKEE